MNKIARVLISSLEVLLLLVLIIFNFNNVSAADEINIVNDFSYEIINGEATITGPIGSGIITEIPSEIDGYPVTEIGSEAFLSNTCYYKDLIIPEGVRKIGYAAFCYEGELFNPETIKSRGYNITIPKIKYPISFIFLFMTLSFLVPISPTNASIVTPNISAISFKF